MKEMSTEDSQEAPKAENQGQADVIGSGDTSTHSGWAFKMTKIGDGR
jgi:hypothetical protein